MYEGRDRKAILCILEEVRNMVRRAGRKVGW